MIERDVYLDYMVNPVIIRYPQGSNGNDFKFNFIDFDIGETSEVRIFVQKPSGKAVFYDAKEVNRGSGSYAVFATTFQMTAEIGKCEGQIEINIDTGTTLTFPLVLEIIESPIASNDHIYSSDEFQALIESLNFFKDAQVEELERRKRQDENDAQQRENNEMARKLIYHVCVPGEYDPDTGVPTLNGREGTIYIVPYTETMNVEYMYVQDESGRYWYEQVGSPDLTNPTDEEIESAFTERIKPWLAFDYSVKADLLVSVTSTPANGERYAEGETVKFKVSFANRELAPVLNVVLSMTLATLDDAEVGTITWESVASGETKEATASYTITEADIGNPALIAQATVTSPTFTLHSNSQPIPVEEKQIDLQHELTITSEGTGENGEYYTWDDVTFSLKLTNNSNVGLRNVTVKKPSADYTISTGDGYTVNDTGDAVAATLARGGNSITVPITLSVPNSMLGQSNIKAKFTVTSSETNEVIDSPEFSVSAESHSIEADIKVTSEGSGLEGKYTTGDKVTYEVDITNNNDSTFNSVQVTVDPPFTIKSLGGYDVNDTSGIISKLDHGETVKAVIEYTLQSSDMGRGDVAFDLTVKAGKKSVTERSEPLDVEEIRRAFELTAQRTGSGTGADGKYTTGDQVAYEITVTNTGNVDLTEMDVSASLTDSEPSLSE